MVHLSCFVDSLRYATDYTIRNQKNYVSVYPITLISFVDYSYCIIGEITTLQSLPFSIFHLPNTTNLIIKYQC